MFPMGGGVPLGNRGPMPGPEQALQMARQGAGQRMDQAQGKESPEQANLREATQPAQSCGTCMAFDGQNGCAKVAGQVNAAQTCDEWSSGDGMDDMAEDRMEAGGMPS